MFCTSCNADIGTRLPKFCPQCGASLQENDLSYLVGQTPATANQDDDATVLIRGATKAPPADTPAQDDDATVLLPPRKAAPQDPFDALLAPKDDVPALLAPRKATPQDPLDALLAPDDDSSKAPTVDTPQEPTDAESIPDNSPTVQLFSRLPAGLLQGQTPAQPSQPDDSIFSAPTVAISGGNTKRRKKKNRKARGRAQSSAPNPPIEPFIGATQTEPVSPFSKPEPTLAAEPFPPLLPEKSDRIVVEPPYPEPFPYPGSSRIPMQSIRQSIPPAVFGLAAFILIVFLGGLWWWNSGEAVSLAEDVGEPLPMSEPLPKVVAPSRPPSAPASPAENTSAFSQDEPPSSEAGLMNIPSLPANQQQGRHNRYNPVIIKDSEPLSTPPDPAPIPALPMPTPPPVQKQASAAPPEPVRIPMPVEIPARMPEPTETPVKAPEPAETPAQKPEFAEAATPPDEIDDTPAPAPRVAAPRPRPRQQGVPPWLGQMRSDLSNCQSFFCRERVRRQYCSDQWEGLPECRGASL